MSKLVDPHRAPQEIPERKLVPKGKDKKKKTAPSMDNQVEILIGKDYSSEDHPEETLMTRSRAKKLQIIDSEENDDDKSEERNYKSRLRRPTRTNPIKEKSHESEDSEPENRIRTRRGAQRSIIRDETTPESQSPLQMKLRRKENEVKTRLQRALPDSTTQQATKELPLGFFDGPSHQTRRDENQITQKPVRLSPGTQQKKPERRNPQREQKPPKNNMPKQEALPPRQQLTNYPSSLPKPTASALNTKRFIPMDEKLSLQFNSFPTQGHPSMAKQTQNKPHPYQQQPWYPNPSNIPSNMAMPYYPNYQANPQISNPMLQPNTIQGPIRTQTIQNPQRDIKMMDDSRNFQYYGKAQPISNPYFTLPGHMQMNPTHNTMISGPIPDAGYAPYTMQSQQKISPPNNYQKMQVPQVEEVKKINDDTDFWNFKFSQENSFANPFENDDYKLEEPYGSFEENGNLFMNPSQNFYGGLEENDEDTLQRKQTGSKNKKLKI